MFNDQIQGTLDTIFKQVETLTQQLEQGQAQWNEQIDQIEDPKQKAYLQSLHKRLDEAKQKQDINEVRNISNELLTFINKLNNASNN